MIIKYTLKDNDSDLIKLIEGYLDDGGGITVSDYYDDDSDLADQIWEEMRALRYIYDLYNKKYFTKEIISDDKFDKIINRIYFLLRDNITRYLYEISEDGDITIDRLFKKEIISVKTIMNNLDISLVPCVPDLLENTGNVYYFPDFEEFISL